MPGESARPFSIVVTHPSLILFDNYNVGVNQLSYLTISVLKIVKICQVFLSLYKFLDILDLVYCIRNRMIE